MRIAVTGTPGTGKTTATALLEERLADGESSIEGDALEVVHLNEVLEEEELYTAIDPDRESKIADLDALADRLADYERAVIESHLAHHFEVDRVVVLRCEPARLEGRLLERGESEAKAAENADSEALDVVLAEAVEEHGLESVYEIDTTDRDPEAVAADLEAVVAGDREPSAGEVDFVGYLE
ncbi:adenylate kinase family protein [Natronococcus sp. A-GB7]|uniref:adenylate kinase family protein n=1 Tax=Natronococcus sp. A-GB7 TaxID=3037649 RepID=UPI00241D2744|nr:adenylate kinase family protein [Natronococcus sp. A-GB7]MDG5818150.1 adenylate kinase family protein [Natronococcus sp. A-GB7]